MKKSLSETSFENGQFSRRISTITTTYIYNKKDCINYIKDSFVSRIGKKTMLFILKRKAIIEISETHDLFSNGYQVPLRYQP